MGKVILVDYKDERRSALTASLNEIDHEYQVKVYETIKTEEIGEELNQENLVVLHVGPNQNEDVMQALNGRYSNLYVICYSGGADVADTFIEHQHDNPKHCWWNQPIGDALSEGTKKTLLMAVNIFFSNDRDGLCRELNPINLELEYKLEILSQIAGRNTLGAIQSREEYDYLVGLGLIDRSKLENALCNDESFLSLRTQFFPE